MTGVVEPQGSVAVWEARTKKPVVSFKPHESAHAKKVKAYRLLGDADNFYLAAEGPRSEDVVSGPRSLFLPWAGFRSIPVNGRLFVFRRATGQFLWVVELSDQMLLVSEVERLPMLLLASGYEKRVGKLPLAAFLAHVTEVRAIAKHNGKLWYVKENVYSPTYFHGIRVDQGMGKVELLGRGVKISMVAVPR